MDKGKPAITTEMTAELKRALALLDSATADEIIRSAPEGKPEYEQLAAGMKALLGLNWGAMRQHGLKQTPEALKSGGQSLVMAMTLVHEAYALGIRRGQGGEGKRLEPEGDKMLRPDEWGNKGG